MEAVRGKVVKSELKEPFLKWALYGGEDYELKVFSEFL